MNKPRITVYPSPPVYEKSNSSSGNWLGDLASMDRTGTVEDTDQRNDDEEEGDESFRQSFYTSGTDWTRLYEVDDYGMPLSCRGEEEGESDPQRKQKLSSAWDHQGKNKATENALSVHLNVKPGSSHMQVSKLVQSDLCSFLGINKPKLEVDKSFSGKRYRQQDVGVLLGISPSLKVQSTGDPAEFLSKFKRVGNSVPKGATPAKNRGGRGGFGVSADGEGQVPRRCPFYKKIPGTSFTVDAFRYGEVEGCTAYFLTHYHSDHYGGLTKRWCHGPIYCTPITARLVVMCLYVDPRWIVPLDLGVTHMIEGLQVRMLEANHCPGAALVLFRLKSGNQILHTGDFRACREMQNYPELLSGNIGTVYLDTTYLNERYRFPLQKEVIQFVIRETSKALKKNSRTLVVVGSYSIGKERVYVSMAEALGVPIFADSHRRRILKALDWPVLAAKLSTDATSTCLHVLPLSNLNPQKLTAYMESHHPKYTEVIAFRPTGWTYSDKLGEKLEFLKPKRTGKITIYGVPYSEHSSFTELQEFVQFIRPEKIIPTVNNGKEEQRERMKSIFGRWLAS